MNADSGVADDLGAAAHGQVPDCPLCTSAGGLLIVRSARWRLVRATDALADSYFPAWYRLIWNAHVPEWSDLGRADQAECMDAVSAVERVLRAHLQPRKINLAALGNVVPHLHWHIVARFAWDSHFPAPMWDAPQRPTDAQRLQELRLHLLACDAALSQAFDPAAASSGAHG